MPNGPQRLPSIQFMVQPQHPQHQPPHKQPSTNNRPFNCVQSFRRSHDLKRHKRIHLAVKPFPCNHCDKSFSRKDALEVCLEPLLFVAHIDLSISVIFSSKAAGVVQYRRHPYLHQYHLSLNQYPGNCHTIPHPRHSSRVKGADPGRGKGQALAHMLQLSICLEWHLPK
jgi:hypothetical protein